MRLHSFIKSCISVRFTATTAAAVSAISDVFWWFLLSVMEQT